MSSFSPALNVVMCPWLAFGHMLPYLELAERLASRGHRVTFVSTPRNIARLRPVRHTAAVISFVALPLPHVDGLPDGAESTHDIPQDKMELLWKAFDGLAAPFAEFFRAACAAADGGARPDCVIFDIFHYWAAATAREYKEFGANVWVLNTPSVVYIALGSEWPLRVDQVQELALGLELAGTRFLWALRKPRGGVPVGEDILPPGFQERTHAHGLVTFSWVPQISILSYGALSAFLTHCGWGSSIEGPVFGCPLIMLPIAWDPWSNAHWDQWSNAQLLENKKVGVQVPRDEKDRMSFSREGVASAVQLVMTEVESRRVFVANAKKLQAIVSDRQLQERYIDGFIQQLASYKEC